MRLIIGAIIGVAFIYGLGSFIAWQFPIDFKSLTQIQRFASAWCGLFGVFIGMLAANMADEL